MFILFEKYQRVVTFIVISETSIYRSFQRCSDTLYIGVSQITDQGMHVIGLRHRVFYH